MRSFQIASAALSILGLLSQSQFSHATPFPLEYDLVLVNRACANTCGYYGQLCCTSSQTCSTNSEGQAVCLDGESSGSGEEWQMYTTTYVVTETDVATITSTWSSLLASSTAAPATGTCRPTLGETPCGESCCSASQMCENKVCVEGASSGYWSSWASASATASPPLRPTSSGEATVTQTGAATTTEPFIAPVGTSGATLTSASAGNKGLSGGAIAGIVIGTIAGVIFLLVLCACLCFKEALDGLMALFGLGGRRTKETTYIEERHSHRSHGSRPERRTWFGTRPSRPAGEKKSGVGGLATIGLILGALALCLGLKRRRDHEDEKSDYTYPSSYYYSDYYTSASSESSDRRTRDTRRSRRSRSRSYR
ncbi:hypothetical protein DTO271G3_8653 [Paecilomyces variotii]|nr:hypothetical protein DTO271G3_8653 [Paecilomyces variotii]